MHSLPAGALETLAAALRPRSNKYLDKYLAEEPRFPSATQQAFLCLDGVEDVLFGGAAGGGKSSALLAAALQYVDVPGYGAMLFRKKYTDLFQPDALIPRSHQWLRGTDAHWDGELKQWRFPSGAVLKFGYLDSMGDEENYQGAAAQFWGFDEAGQLNPWQMEYLKTRARRDAKLGIPIRFRYSANPGGRAHEWLVENFILPAGTNGKLFIPSKAVDNPGLDVADYLTRLDAITDEVLRAQMRDGDWGAVDRSGLVVPEFTPECEARVVRSDAVLPPYFTAYAGVDTGSRDLTVDLLGHLDFVRGVLVVTHEVVFSNPRTSEMGEAIVALEREAWGEARTARKVDATLRFCDVDWRFVQDLNEAPYHLQFVPTAKTDATMHERLCRTALHQGRIEIHPRCKVLIRTLKHARWNERRTDYERTPETGHADAWKALVYMHRNVQWTRNPYPPAEDTTVLRRPVPRGSPQARKLGKALGGGLKPLV